ncbi:MAG TPA: response regulator [Xanthomonadaceae bacterium]|nr:response regulator [Xanthomonadaceae bacterium]
MPTVLIIDDNPAVATALETLFSLHEIDAASAASPEEGLVRLQRGDIDLVVQDMNFHADTTSGEEGVELFKSIRARHPDLPVILLTARAQESDVETGFDSGADDYITKPFSPRDLASRVEALLTGAG